MVLPLVMAGLGMAGQVANSAMAAGAANNRMNARQEGEDAFRRMQAEQANTQFGAAQGAMMDTAGMGGTSSGQASAKMAAMNQAPQLFAQAQNSSANAAKMAYDSADQRLTGNTGRDDHDQAAVMGPLTGGMKSLGSMFMGGAAGGAAGGMLSDARAKVLEDENAALRKQLNQQSRADDESVSFINQRIKGGEAYDDAVSGVPDYLASRIEHPLDRSMSSDEAAAWLMKQPKGRVASLQDKPKPRPARAAPKADIDQFVGPDWKSDSEFSMFPTEFNQFGGPPKKPPISMDHGDVVPKRWEEPVVAPPWESENSVPPRGDDHVVAPPWEVPVPGPRSQPASPPPQYFIDQRKILRGASGGGRPFSEDEINQAIEERWRSEPHGELSDARAKVLEDKLAAAQKQNAILRENGGVPREQPRASRAPAASPQGEPSEAPQTGAIVRGPNGYYHSDQKPTGYGGAFAPGKMAGVEGAGAYGDGSNSSKVHTSANGVGNDWDGRGDWSAPKPLPEGAPHQYFDVGKGVLDERRGRVSDSFGYANPESPPKPTMGRDWATDYKAPLGGPQRGASLVLNDDPMAELRGSPERNFTSMFQSPAPAAQASSAPTADVASQLNSMAKERYGAGNSSPFQSPIAPPKMASVSPDILSEKEPPLSDERTKSAKGKTESTSMVEQAPGYFYRYKGGFGEDSSKRHYGPMAQDLEKTPVGRTVVTTGNDGVKRVDTDRLTLAHTGVLHDLVKRIENIEGGKRRGRK